MTKFLIVFLFVLLALALLGIGWLCTGKSRIVRGACGMDPNQLRNKQCGTPQYHCDLCDQDHKYDQEN